MSEFSGSLSWVAHLSQLAFPRDGYPNFPWEKSHWDNALVKAKQNIIAGYKLKLHDQLAKTEQNAESLSQTCLPLLIGHVMPM